MNRQHIYARWIRLFGCGAFQNPPEAAARAFSNIFREYAKCFETVEFAVLDRDRDNRITGRFQK